MQTVGVKALKNQLSHYLRAVAAGETVRVTDRGVLVAEITRPRAPAAGATEAEILADLVRRGLAQPARIGPKTPLPKREPVMSFDEMMRDLDESRADR